MPRTTRVRQQFGGGRKRQTEWSICSVPTGYSTIAANSKVILVLFPASFLDIDSPATIVRSRGVLSVAAVDAAADNEEIGAFGCGFVNAVAGALGVTALPGPATNCDWGGWFVWQPFISQTEVVTQAGFDGQFGKQYVIDSKAQRKFEDNENLVWIIENNTAVAFSAAVAIRMLVKAG